MRYGRGYKGDRGKEREKGKGDRWAVGVITWKREETLLTALWTFEYDMPMVSQQ